MVSKEVFRARMRKREADIRKSRKKDPFWIEEYKKMALQKKQSLAHKRKILSRYKKRRETRKKRASARRGTSRKKTRH